MFTVACNDTSAGRLLVNEFELMLQSPIKSYKCKYCGKSYAHKSTLDRHLKYECGITPQFNCKKCSYRAKHKSQLMRHCGLIHNSQLEEEEASV